jgi:hypothetical protein
MVQWTLHTATYGLTLLLTYYSIFKWLTNKISESIFERAWFTNIARDIKYHLISTYVQHPCDWRWWSFKLPASNQHLILSSNLSFLSKPIMETSKILIAATTKITVFWDAMLCSLIFRVDPPWRYNTIWYHAPRDSNI